MKYTLKTKEWISPIHRRAEVSYEVQAKNLQEAVEKLSRHIFHMNKLQIAKELIHG